MKKVISVLIVLVFVLSGCNSIAKDSLGNNNWEFSRIIETENGKVAFSSENNSTKFSDAKIIDLSCTANDNEIILKDNTKHTQKDLLEECERIINEHSRKFKKTKNR